MTYYFRCPEGDIHQFDDLDAVHAAMRLLSGGRVWHAYKYDPVEKMYWFVFPRLKSEGRIDRSRVPLMIVAAAECTLDE
jgi:hypothetical protein